MSKLKMFNFKKTKVCTKEPESKKLILIAKLTLVTSGKKLKKCIKYFLSQQSGEFRFR